METKKEKKIVTSTIKLQEYLFKYKNLCRDLPDEITEKQKKDLLLATAKCLLLTHLQIEQLTRLVKSLDNKAISNQDLLELSLKNKTAEAMFEYLEAEHKESEGN